MMDGARVVHHIPGRLRVKLPRASRNPALLRQLQDFVSGLGGVRQVEVNPVTGSILVHYHPESREQIESLMKSAGSTPAGYLPPELADAGDLANRIVAEADFLSAHSQLAQHIVNGVKALDQAVREATDNAVDLKVLLPAGLAIWAYLKSSTEAATPLWATLAIFSFNSFVSLHRPIARRASPAAVQFDQ